MVEEKKYRPLEVQPALSNPLPLAGWALVIGSLISYAYLLLPPRLMDVEWEFETMEPLVNNSLLALLGMALVLHGRAPVVDWQKLVTLRCLLVFSLLLGIFYLLMVPLAFSDEQRLESKQDSQLNEAQVSLKERMSKVEVTMKKVSTLKDLQALGAMLNFVPPEAQRKELKLDEDFDALQKWTKNQMLFFFHEQAQQVKAQHDRNILQFEKKSLRIMAGAILAAFCYFALVSMNFGLFRQHVTEPAVPQSEN